MGGVTELRPPSLSMGGVSKAFSERRLTRLSEIQVLSGRGGNATDNGLVRLDGVLRAENGRLREELAKRAEVEHALRSQLERAEASCLAEQATSGRRRTRRAAQKTLQEKLDEEEARRREKKRVLGSQQVELQDLRQHSAGLAKAEASNAKFAQQLKTAEAQLHSLRTERVRLSAAEAEKKHARSSAALAEAKTAAAAAEVRALKAERAAQHREILLRQLRVAHTALEQRHRHLQAAVREREADVHGARGAAEATPGYARVLEERCRERERQVFALETRISTLLQSEGRAKQRAHVLTKTCGAMKAQLTTVTAEANALAQERRWERAAAPPQVASATDIRVRGGQRGQVEADEAPSFERPRTAQLRVLVPRGRGRSFRAGAWSRPARSSRPVRRRRRGGGAECRAACGSMTL